MTEEDDSSTLPEWAREYASGERSDDGIFDCVTGPACRPGGVRRGLEAFAELTEHRQREMKELFPDD